MEKQVYDIAGYSYLNSIVKDIGPVLPVSRLRLGSVPSAVASPVIATKIRYNPWELRIRNVCSLIPGCLDQTFAVCTRTLTRLGDVHAALRICLHSRI